MRLRLWFHENIGKKWVRRLVAPVLALGLTASLASYELARPATARAAAEPAAAALNPESVSSLLAFDHAMETVAARVTPAVVNVTVTARKKPAMSDQQLYQDMRRFFGGFGDFLTPHMHAQPQVEHGNGSGVVISPSGYIVTNNHVVDGAVDIQVTTSDRRVLKATLVGADPLTDLAVLKVDANNLASVPWGDSKQVRPGETVLAFGSPYGFRFTVTRGIVSAVNRPNPDASDARKPGEFIQTDAAINPGNSGGPLVDARGEVIGINTFLISPSGTSSGMGFAIPAQIAEPTVEKLIRYGKVSHGRIGIGVSDVTPENAKFFDVSNASGAVVTQVEPGSAGAKAGLQTGDVITRLDGQSVGDAGELQVMVGQKEPGAKVTLELDRNGKSMSVPVTLQAMESAGENGDSAGGSQGKLRWGLGLSNLTPELRQQLEAPHDLRGAVVERVQPGSAADNAGLQQGDVILEVNRHKVQSAAEVQQALTGVAKGADALLLVWSDGGNSFRVLHPTQGG